MFANWRTQLSNMQCAHNIIVHTQRLQHLLLSLAPHLPSLGPMVTCRHIYKLQVARMRYATTHCLQWLVRLTSIKLDRVSSCSLTRL